MYCRKAHFEQHVVEWLADPKGSDALVECWINHWTQVDEGLGGRLKAELAGRKVRPCICGIRTYRKPCLDLL